MLWSAGNGSGTASASATATASSCAECPVGDGTSPPPCVPGSRGKGEGMLGFARRWSLHGDGLCMEMSQPHCCAGTTPTVVAR